MTHFMITASATRDGRPIYLQENALWTEDFSRGFVTESLDRRDQMLTQAQEDEKTACDPYAITVICEGGTIKPKSLKEKIRATGPTTVSVEAKGV